MFWKQDKYEMPKRGALHALAAFLYVFLVAMFISNIGHFMGPKDPALAPVAMLMLLVVSAATMGLLVFGKPVMLYIDGKKREAVQMVGWTIAGLAAITVCVFAFMMLTYA